MRKIDRLQFLQLAGGVLGAGVATTAAACGGDDAGAPAGPACDVNAPRVTIASNHGHLMTVTAAEAKAAAGKTYNIMGGAPHDHTVMLTANDFQTLEKGATVYAQSSVQGDGHSHSITVICG